MDDGKHDILPVAGAILDHARMPVMLPRQSDADMRRDGSTTAQTVPNLPSMSAEECTAPQDSHTGIGSTRWLSSKRTLSQNRASLDTVESRRRRWPRRDRDPRKRPGFALLSALDRISGFPGPRQQFRCPQRDDSSFREQPAESRARRGSCPVRCGRPAGSGSDHASAPARTGSLRRACCFPTAAEAAPRARRAKRRRLAWSGGDEPQAAVQATDRERQLRRHKVRRYGAAPRPRLARSRPAPLHRTCVACGSSMRRAQHSLYLPAARTRRSRRHEERP